MTATNDNPSPNAPDFPPRWTATAYYRTASGIIDVNHQFEELSELNDLIERGPDWSCLVRIEVKFSVQTPYDITLEETLER